MLLKFEQGQFGCEHQVADLERLFNACFRASENTVLVSGGNEPLYLPALSNAETHKITSTKDYFSSALHEISHWCIAGVERRKLLDYGYWYEPDGRDEQRQGLFESVEVKPQALEWVFSLACNVRFRLSVDNVAQPELKPSTDFMANIVAQARTFADFGLPPRAALFCDALLAFYWPGGFELKAQSFEQVMLL
mgnify:FL=1